MTEWLGLLSERFQFPSNGKAYPKTTGKAGEDAGELKWGFNSLQTGKHIQSKLKGTKDAVIIIVSISFKRESISKAFSDQCFSLAAAFQFPSNGKAYPKELKNMPRK